MSDRTWSKQSKRIIYKTWYERKKDVNSWSVVGGTAGVDVVIPFIDRGG